MTALLDEAERNGGIASCNSGYLQNWKCDMLTLQCAHIVVVMKPFSHHAFTRKGRCVRNGRHELKAAFCFSGRVFSGGAAWKGNATYRKASADTQRTSGESIGATCRDWRDGCYTVREPDKKFPNMPSACYSGQSVDAYTAATIKAPSDCQSRSSALPPPLSALCRTPHDSRRVVVPARKESDALH